MARNPLLLVAVGVCVLCTASAQAARYRGRGVVVERVGPVRATAARRPAKKAVNRVKVAPLPGPVNKQSLGFGSTREDVLRLMGRPTRVAKGMNGAVWFYDLSTITLKNGKVVAWTKYNRPLPMNIGAAKPGARPAKMGAMVQQVIAARGTPDTVSVQGVTQVWFYGADTYTIRGGKVVPTDFGAGSKQPTAQATQAPKEPAAEE